MIVILCLNCKKEMEVNKKNKHLKKFCSRKCTEQYAKENK